jgi:hypothetical protein
MKDSPLKVTLDEITPDKIIEIENYLLSERFVDLVKSNLAELGNYRQMIRAHLENIEASCKIRAVRALGADRALPTAWPQRRAPHLWGGA